MDPIDHMRDDLELKSQFSSSRRAVAERPLDEHGVHPAPMADDRDFDPGRRQRAGEEDAGKLAAPIGVEDVQPPLIALGQIGYRRLLLVTPPKANLVFSVASIFRLILWMLIGSVYHNETPCAPIKPLILKISTLSHAKSQIFKLSNIDRIYAVLMIILSKDGSRKSRYYRELLLPRSHVLNGARSQDLAAYI
jgi:hypothetical protein